MEFIFTIRMTKFFTLDKLQQNLLMEILEDV